MALAEKSRNNPSVATMSSQQGQPHDRMSSQRSRNSNDSVQTSITQKMLSAVTGSVLTSLLVTPLDVVRVRLQSQTQSSPSFPSSSASSADFVRLPPNTGISACCREVFWVQNQSQFCVTSSNGAAITNDMLISGCAAEETQRRAFNSTLDGLRKIARNEGVTTLWRGLSPTLLMAVPANVIYFAGYDWMRFNEQSPIRKMGENTAPLIAGSIARVAAAIAVGPIEMLRTRMQASHPSSTGAVLRETITGLQEMVSESGYRSLWRGLGLTMWRDVPFSAFYWWGYEYGRVALNDMRVESRQQAAGLAPNVGSGIDLELDHKAVLIDSFVAGATSGAIAAFVTTPFDVGKTRQQTFRHDKGAALDSARGTLPKVVPEEMAMPRFLWHIFKTEGTAGLFKGWAARCMKVAPACAIMISTYEVGKKMAGDMNDDEK